MTIKKCKNMTENSAKDFKKCTINLYSSKARQTARGSQFHRVVPCYYYY